MSEIDAKLIDYARRHGGVVTRSEAIALGMSERTVKRRIFDGQLVGLANGALVLPGILDSEETSLRAASYSIGAVASHESAARMHGIDRLDAKRWTASVPIRRSNRFGPLQIHQLTDIEPEDIVVIREIPVTIPSRAAVDLAAVLPARLLADVVDQFAGRRITTYEQIGARLEALARRGKPGVAKLRKIIKARSNVAMAPESTLESMLLDLLITGGLPTPTTQFHAPWLRQQSGRVDLAYVECRLVIEADGRHWHGSPEAFQADRRRDNTAQLAGWTILRFTWEDVTKRESYVLDTVAAALNRSVFSGGHI